ncbi:MAG: hypothetical protein HYR55_08715 [Acidobacteria bacterium]|nr:hypothetical protein [Acidobacteriota bacterium]
MPEIGVQKVTLRPSLSVEQAVRDYRAQPSVEFAEPKAFGTPPYVSGEAALLWSALGTDTSNRVVRDLIEATSDNVGAWVAKGRVNVFDALRRTREAWVDFGYRGERHGTFEKPFNTGAQGISGVIPGTTLYIKAGSTAETARIAKALTIRAYGGTVTLGRN